MSGPYETLGLHPDADPAIVDKVYRELVKKHHPDHGGDKGRFKEIKNAYESITSGDTPDGKESFPFNSIFSYPVEKHNIKGRYSSGLTIEGQALTVTLMGLFKSNVADICIGYDNDPIERYVVITHVHNTSNHLQEWKPLEESKFIDEEGYTYTPTTKTQVDPYTEKLPPRIEPLSVELEPGTKGNTLLILPKIPDGVAPKRAIFTHQHFDGDQTDGWVEGEERFEFEIEAEHRKELKPADN